MTFGLSSGQREAIVCEIGRRLSDALRPGWSRATFTWTAVVGGGSVASLSVVDAEGNSRGEDIPDGIGTLCGRLKNNMYRPGFGTWLTMTYELSADSSYTTDFDYDGRPQKGGFVPEHYAKEIARFPRDPEHIPDWLKATLDRVPNVYIGVYAEPGEQYSEGIGPHTGEVARAFDQGGWTVGRSEYNGEFEFATDWATLQTLSKYGLVRLAGKVARDRWDDLIAFFTQQGWRFGATLYNGDDIMAQVDPRPE